MPPTSECLSEQTVDKPTHRKNAWFICYSYISLSFVKYNFVEPKSALQKHFCLLCQESPTVPLYADGDSFLVCVCFSKSSSLSKNTFSTSYADKRVLIGGGCLLKIHKSLQDNAYHHNQRKHTCAYFNSDTQLFTGFLLHSDDSPLIYLL